MFRPISPDLEDPTLIHRERAEKVLSFVVTQTAVLVIRKYNFAAIHIHAAYFMNPEFCLTRLVSEKPCLLIFALVGEIAATGCEKGEQRASRDGDFLRQSAEANADQARARYKKI